MTAGLKGLAVAVATALGALVAVGLVLEALFEAQGFGRPRDTDPRTGYFFLLALGLAACVAAPVWLWRTLLPESAPAWPLAFGAAVVGVVVILGIGFA
ncbi:MAG: hypothetical protein ACYC1P_06900 [Gaiellaceae bacterium]